MRKLTTAEAFWYVLMNIAMGAAYFAKVPVKRAMLDAGLINDVSTAEKFWYVLLNVAFGSGYFAKIIVAKALSEAAGPAPRPSTGTGDKYALLALGLDS